MTWCFAKINGRLAELYFDENKSQTKFVGHCYVKKSEYKTERELKWIELDSKKYKFKFKNLTYYNLLDRSKVHPLTKDIKV